jgi:hypothetical protein
MTVPIRPSPNFEDVQNIRIIGTFDTDKLTLLPFLTYLNHQWTSGTVIGSSAIGPSTPLSLIL